MNVHEINEMDEGIDRQDTVNYTACHNEGDALAQGKRHQDDAQQKRRAGRGRIERLNRKDNDQTNEHHGGTFGEK